MTDIPDVSSQETPRPAERPKWVLPAVAIIVVVTPVIIFIFSNTDSAEFGWAGLTWEAPRWIILVVTFAAGAVGGKLLGWGWRRYRARRRRLKDELEVLKKHQADD